MTLSILDCTLRDGGYYNAWDFDHSTVERYLAVMQQTSVDWVEIGFRFAPQDAFVGPYGYSTDVWLRRLEGLNGIRLGVMCNAKDLLTQGDPADAIQRMFAPAVESPIELVRIAAHFHEVEHCAPAIEALHSLGYRIGFNLMQAAGHSEETLLEKVAALADMPLDVLYFADSLGSMSPADVQQTVITIQQGWDKAIGFHAHDNMGRALANAWAAYEAGASWIDGTVLGMGRGAGNLRLEYWLLDLERHGLRSTQVDALLALVVNEFSDLQARYGWGPNLFYHLSAMYGVHPTYVQEMLADDRYNHDQVISALTHLGASGTPSYNPERLRQALGTPAVECNGEWDVRGWLQNQPVILVGPGEGGRLHQSGLLQLLEHRAMPVLCLNSNPWLPDEHVTAWVACNPQRMAMDRDYYAARTGMLIAPGPIAEEQLGDIANQWQLRSYGLKIVSDEFQPDATFGTLPQPLAALYGLAVANAAGCSRIFMVGFDGYDRSDPRHEEMEKALQAYYAYEDAAPLIALTPTNLSITQNSLYAPDL